MGSGQDLLPAGENENGKVKEKIPAHRDFFMIILFFLLFRRHWPPFIDDQAVEKISKELVPAFHIFWVIFCPEYSAKFTFGNLKIDKSTNLHNIIIA